MEVLNYSIWTGITIIIAGAGVIATVFAILGIKTDLINFKKTEEILRKNTDINKEQEFSDPLSRDSQKFFNWLYNVLRVKKDSHLSDLITFFWGGWRARTLIQQAEIHNIIVRREKQRFSAKVSNIIASSLLILGIIGTLCSVHPILSSFNIEVTADGTVEASKGASDVKNMINGLANAFKPSIAALLGTLVIVVFRFFYTRSAHELSQELYRFSINTLYSLYEVKSEQGILEEMSESLKNLTKELIDTKNDAEKVTETLNQSAATLNEITQNIKPIATNLSRASSRMEKVSMAYFDEITDKLGEESNLAKSLANQELQSLETLKVVSELKETSKGINDYQKALEVNLNALPEKVTNLTNETVKGVLQPIGDIPDQLDGISKSIQDTKTELSEASKNFKEANQLIADKVQKTLSSSLAETKGELISASSALVNSSNQVASNIEEKLVANMQKSASQAFTGVSQSIEKTTQRLTQDNAETRNAVAHTLKNVERVAQGVKPVKRSGRWGWIKKRK